MRGRRRIAGAALACVVLIVGACGGGETNTTAENVSAPPSVTATTMPATTNAVAATQPDAVATSAMPTPAASTTTTGIDPAGPNLAIVDPLDGATVTTRLYQFRGTVAAGASVVAAGSYDVAVGADGSWSIALVLNPGGNVVTFRGTDDAGMTDTLSIAVAYEPPIELQGDGLGIVDFGTPTDEALEILTNVLGPPTGESESFYDYRTWDSLRLTVAFDDYAFYRDDGIEHLVAWSLWGDPSVALRTSAGVGLGGTYAELVAAHGDAVGEPISADDCMPEWYVWLNDPGSDTKLRVLVSFEGSPAAGGRIASMRAGASEGC